MMFAARREARCPTDSSCAPASGEEITTTRLPSSGETGSVSGAGTAFSGARSSLSTARSASVWSESSLAG